MFSGAIVIIALTFFSGVYVGAARKPYIERVVSIVNKEPPLPVGSTTDFDPFWKAWAILNENFISFKASSTDQDRVWGSIEGLAASYKDPYTVFFPPAEAKSFQASISGEFSGVGMEIGLRDRVITVIAPLKNTPAERAGIRAGDRILEIDGQTTEGMTVEKAVSLIRGQKGTTVRLSILHEGARSAVDVSVTRDTIAIPTLDTETRADGIFVIKLYSFTANSPALFRDALEAFARTGGDKLILDLRNNPGGYLEAAVDMASWFLPEGKVVVSEEGKKESTRRVFRSKGYDVFNGKPLKFVILVNEGSASASEILAGALSEHKVAKLVGEKTFGKGSVQQLFDVTPETSLKVTVARWLTPNGNSISEGGLKPDIEVALVPADFEKGKDAQLNRAVDYLLKGR